MEELGLKHDQFSIISIYIIKLSLMTTCNVTNLLIISQLAYL